MWLCTRPKSLLTLVPRVEGQSVPIQAIREAQLPRDAETVRLLFEAYVRELGVDLSFQGFSQEVSDLAAAYPPPGGLWLAFDGSPAPVGAVGLRPLAGGYAELKRLFVQRQARGLGLGRALLTTALTAARARGFQGVRLDSLEGMTEAQALYAASGFHPIAAYRENPFPGAQFLELTFG